LDRLDGVFAEEQPAVAVPRIEFVVGLAGEVAPAILLDGVADGRNERVQKVNL
jgi:hypothetical protein